MCTASWYYSEDGSYSLFFNRDESRMRSIALAPVVYNEGSVAFHCPIDRDGGGTWILSNQYGVSMCLLNHYDFAPREPDSTRISRGQLLLTLAKSKSTSVFVEELLALDVSVYRAFTLLALDLNKHVTMMHWDGEELCEIPDVYPPLTSSSHEAEKVCNYRIALFNMIMGDENASHQLYENFHHMHDPNHPALSPWMAREDAATVSYTRIDVGQGGSEMTYSAVSQNELCFMPETHTSVALV